MTEEKVEGLKDDYKDNKVQWHLLDLTMLEGVVRLYEFGLKKYKRNSWKYIEDGEERCYSAAIRHLNLHRKGEELDKESGQMHIDAAIWNLLTMKYHYLKNKDNGES